MKNMKQLSFLYDAYSEDGKCSENTITVDVSDENAELMLQGFEMFERIKRIVFNNEKLMGNEKCIGVSLVTVGVEGQK